VSDEASQFLREAKACHTRLAWRDLLCKLKEYPSTFLSSRQLAELFKLLKSDPQSLQYDPEIWYTLLTICQSKWDLDLGAKVADFASKIPSSQIAIPSASIHMQNGSPLAARKIASRALRLTTLEAWERLQLQMIVCNCYVEEGKSTMALRLLSQMQIAIASSGLATANLADLIVNMGRAQFFMGRYPEAAKNFAQASEIYMNLHHWEAAAKSLFNAGACYHNSGISHEEQAFTYIENCKNLCIQNKLDGPLSHCYAFYGTVDYQKGRFLNASKYYKMALDHAPEADKSFRRLHITSMLAFTYLAMGHYQLGEKLGEETIKMASLDDSERFKSRYKHLQAVLHWQRGEFESSQEIMQESVKPLITQGVNTLEELSMMSFFFQQAALLNDASITTKVKIADQLKDDTASWLEYLISLSRLLLTKGKYLEALKVAKECYKKSILCGAQYNQANSILVIIQIYLTQSLINEELNSYISKFNELLQTNDFQPLKVHIYFIAASLAYKQGDFPSTIKHLTAATKHKKIDTCDQIVLTSWMTTVSGRSPKLNSPWHIRLLTLLTKIYFSPSIEAMGEHAFKVSDKYIVKLDRHPILSNILEFLMSQSNHDASPALLQESVWTQSLQTQGWQQKIRNTIMRLREFFPQTIAPLILHSDNKVSLFKEAISIAHPCSNSQQTETIIMTLLRDQPYSSRQLAKSSKVSQATVKRVIKKLQSKNVLCAIKVGRNIQYKLAATENQTIQN
jgi:tetratricopeptide (TPR) repeat protein/biotin operon repressor